MTPHVVVLGSSSDVPRPDPEVPVDAKRRTFAAEYKQRVLAAADEAAVSGPKAPR